MKRWWYEKEGRIKPTQPPVKQHHHLLFTRDIKNKNPKPFCVFEFISREETEHSQTSFHSITSTRDNPFLDDMTRKVPTGSTQRDNQWLGVLLQKRKEKYQEGCREHPLSRNENKQNIKKETRTFITFLRERTAKQHLSANKRPQEETRRSLQKLVDRTCWAEVDRGKKENWQLK
jgi:hypothetical protein